MRIPVAVAPTVSAQVASPSENQRGSRRSTYDETWWAISWASTRRCSSPILPGITILGSAAPRA